MFKDCVLNENAYLDVLDSNRTMNAIIEAVVNEDKIELLDEVSAKTIGASIVQFVKKIAGYILGALDVAFNFIAECFNRNYAAFKKYKYLAGSTIDFNKQITMKLPIRSVSQVNQDMLYSIIGRLPQATISSLTDISDILSGNNTIGMDSSIKGLDIGVKSIGDDGKPDKSKYIQYLRADVLLGDHNIKLDTFEYKTLNQVVSSHSDIKKMLSFLSNRRPMTAFAVSKQKVRVMCNRLIQNAIKNGAADGEIGKLVIKSLNKTKSEFASAVNSIKSIYRDLGKVYRVVLSHVASATNDKPKDHKDDIKATKKKAQGSSYVDFD